MMLIILWTRSIAAINRLGPIAEGELDDVIADVAGPAGDQADKPPPIVGEQRPRGFLEAGEIAGHRGHEMIGGVSRGAGAISDRRWRGAPPPRAFAAPPMRRRAAPPAIPNAAATASPRGRPRRVWAARVRAAPAQRSLRLVPDSRRVAAIAQRCRVRCREDPDRAAGRWRR